MTKTIPPLNYNRSKWGSGPWDGEPDRIEFETQGFTCLMVRNLMGVWCGYVAVPPDHPAYQCDFDDLDIDVHGGLTFAGPCRGQICRAPKPGQPEDVWWLGFDCAHGGDVIPSSNEYHFPAFPGDTYKAVPFVRREIERLAVQLKLMTNK